MRFALILALLLAVLAAVFALQNPGYSDINLGPYYFRMSTALLIILTFGLGAVVGILAAIPGRVRARRQVRVLEKRIVDERSGTVHPHTTSETTTYVREDPDTGL